MAQPIVKHTSTVGSKLLLGVPSGWERRKEIDAKLANGYRQLEDIVLILLATSSNSLLEISTPVPGSSGLLSLDNDYVRW